jgi:hypothetical protein
MTTLHLLYSSEDLLDVRGNGAFALPFAVVGALVGLVTLKLAAPWFYKLSNAGRRKAGLTNTPAVASTAVAEKQFGANETQQSAKKRSV